MADGKDPGIVNVLSTKSEDQKDSQSDDQDQKPSKDQNVQLEQSNKQEERQKKQDEQENEENQKIKQNEIAVQQYIEEQQKSEQSNKIKSGRVSSKHDKSNSMVDVIGRDMDKMPGPRQSGSILEDFKVKDELEE